MGVMWGNLPCRQMVMMMIYDGTADDNDYDATDANYDDDDRKDDRKDNDAAT